MMDGAHLLQFVALFYFNSKFSIDLYPDLETSLLLANYHNLLLQVVGVVVPGFLLVIPGNQIIIRR